MNDPNANMDLQTCAQAFAWVNEYLDGALDDATEEAVERHLALCEACAHHFAFERDLLEALRERCQTGRAPDRLRRRVTESLRRLQSP